jgi:parallel beta-helix repeat protein
MHSIFPARLCIILALAAIAALATVVGLSVTSRPAAEAGRVIDCGDIIGPGGGPFFLDRDVEGCTGPGPMLTVRGPVVLDLNGHTVACTNREVANPTTNFVTNFTTNSTVNFTTNSISLLGIRIEGTGAVVKNGHVSHCQEGVLVEGNGFHRVSNLDVSETLDNQTGIVVNSNYNLIFRNDVHDNLSTGILVRGNANVIKRNTVHDNPFFEGEGISIEGHKNIVIWNIANNNGPEPDTVPFSTDGIDVSGSRNLVALNTTNNNADDGIDVSGQKNLIIFNRSFGNGFGTDSANWDMEDGNGDCDSNFWRWNSFEDSDPACIRRGLD